jgi:hypothetical protein
LFLLLLRKTPHVNSRGVSPYNRGVIFRVPERFYFGGWGQFLTRVRRFLELAAILVRDPS